MESALGLGQVKSPDTLKRGHLKEGVPAIMACLGTPEQFWESDSVETPFRIKHWKVPEAHNVDFYAPSEGLREKNFKVPYSKSYVISPIDSLDKFSQSFRDCVGLVATGYDKKTGENISILSHQDPNYFLNREANRDIFVSDLKERLMELKERCSEGTIDVAIVGGNDFNDKDAITYQSFQKNYLGAVKLLSDETEKILGFEPVVMTGPKKAGGEEDVFYENKNRKLYITRSEVGDNSTQSFTQSAIDDQKKKWGIV